MILDRILDLFRGKAITIPPMDGALRPNNELDQAKLLLKCEAPDNLAMSGGRVYCTSGARLFSLPQHGSPSPSLVAEFASPISALAASESGTMAVGLQDGGIELLAPDLSRRRIEGFNCPVALVFAGPQDLYVCNGSDKVKPSDWVVDLMRKDAAGSVWHVPLAGGEQTCLCRDMAYPYGVVVDAAAPRLIISEAWRHRLVSLPLSGGLPQPVLSNLPGYPARLSRQPGGYLLCLFAPRNRLIEFVLNEDAYRHDMMQEIESRYWIAPSLSASRSFLEPLQSGAVKSMGIHKPWSPSRSYGLVIELDAELQPVKSYHSRANGTRHGVTSALRRDDVIIAASRGGDAILLLEPGSGEL